MRVFGGSGRESEAKADWKIVRKNTLLRLPGPLRYFLMVRNLLQDVLSSASLAFGEAIAQRLLEQFPQEERAY